MKMLKNIAFFAVVALCFGCSDKGKNTLFELMKEEDTEFRSTIKLKILRIQYFQLPKLL